MVGWWALLFTSGVRMLVTRVKAPVLSAAAENCSKCPATPDTHNEHYKQHMTALFACSASADGMAGCCTSGTSLVRLLHTCLHVSVVASSTCRNSC
jgi:hypothetical protein